MTKAKATAADMNREVELAKARAKARPQEYGRAVDATGTPDAPASPNPTVSAPAIEVTESMVERGGIVLARQVGGNTPWDQMPGNVRNDYRSAALACLVAALETGSEG